MLQIPKKLKEVKITFSTCFIAKAIKMQNKNPFGVWIPERNKERCVGTTEDCGPSVSLNASGNPVMCPTGFYRWEADTPPNHRPHDLIELLISVKLEATAISCSTNLMN